MIRKLFLLIVFATGLAGCAPQEFKSTNVPTNEPLPSEAAPDKNLSHFYIMAPSPNNERFDLYIGITKIAHLDKAQAIHLKLLPDNATYPLTIKDLVYGEAYDIRTTLTTTAPGKVAYWVIDEPFWAAGDAKLSPVTEQEGLRSLKKYTLVKPLVSDETIALAGQYTTLEDRDACIKTNQLDKCLKLQSELPATLLPDAVTAKIAQIKAQEAQRQKLEAMESKLPAKVRRDKYMVQLSSYLKQQNFKAALDVFPKLEALPIATDPSLKFFYGESLLKTNQPGKALKKLYEYINEQGTHAAHYAQALDLINQAESEL